MEFLCPYTYVSSHPVFIVWKCVQGLLGTSCVGRGRINLLVCSRQPQEKEEEMLASQTLWAKAWVKKFWRRALSVALVVRCRRRSSNKPPTVKHWESTSTTSEPVRWKWRVRTVGLDSSSQDLSCPIDSFWEAVQNFLHLPQLLCTLCNHD